MSQGLNVLVSVAITWSGDSVDEEKQSYRNKYDVILGEIVVIFDMVSR